MHGPTLNDWVQDRVEELVSQFGVPRVEADSLMRYVRNGAVVAEAEARSDAQFLLDLRRIGTRAMAQRGGCTTQAVNKRKTKLQKRNTGLSAQLSSSA